MATLRHRLMLEESSRRLKDAKLLGNSNLDNPFSDSAHLLTLLGFELLLKLVFELTMGMRAPQHHKYKALFHDLPAELREELEPLAKSRVGPNAFSTALDNILDDWSSNFIALRYPYERYSKMSEDEYAQHSRNWVARGGPLDEAAFRYHPEALFGMVEALSQVATRHG